MTLCCCNIAPARLAAFITFALASTLACPVQAEPVCGSNADRQFDAVRVYSKSFTASCKPGGECVVSTHRMDDKAALGFSHTFNFHRTNPAGTWQVMLVALNADANTQASFSLKVDKNKAMIFSTEHIKPGTSTNEYMLDPALTDLVLAEVKPGNTVVWSYTTSSGESSNVPFSLAGVTDALEWASCAQAQLVSGKTDPIGLEKPEPVLSAPDPSVPVDPVGDGSD